MPLNLMLILILLAQATLVFAQGGIASPDPDQYVDQLLNRMTPEERIGQLFLVTFQGNSVEPDLPIYDLISNHHIGGVVLTLNQDNIVPVNGDPKSVPEQVQILINNLQQVEWDNSTTSRIDQVTGLSYLPNYVPLFVGISQEGGGAPNDQILSGLTALPNQMAIGATWNPDFAAEVGKVLGKELSALGFNLLIGPSLDVLDLPQVEITNNLGARTFGGDPFWVSEMGRAYIRGIHEGSSGNLAVAAKHFPGHGSSDRLPEEEVATVRKSLDELKTIDLAPFLTVTGNALAPTESTDALLSSHIRYQGLQGNIRTTTRPVSLDPQAMSLLMELPGLASWRAKGGVLISDDLGNNAIRRFYNLTNQAFDPRRVTLNAFLAGNDVLFITDFSTTNDLDSYAEAVKTLDFFAQKYKDDSAFAQRVDESVRRILRLKYKLNPNFDLQKALPETQALAEIGQGTPVTFSVARNAATLLSPSQAELDSTMPDPPNQNGRIVFIVDEQTTQQCSKCPVMTILSKTALQEAVVRLYGPQAGRLVSVNNLSSFSFEDLNEMLNSRGAVSDLERDLERANWIVMAATKDQGGDASYETIKHFLEKRPDLFQQKRLIVFALSAPYYLDATNISKLTAYFALYSKQAPFIDIATYLLFGELRASGASPVSVPGIGYNLNEVLFPDPNQIIPLEFDLPAPQEVITGTATPASIPDVKIGDVIPLRAGVIFDHNGKPVPDGTPVNFIFSYGRETTSIRQTTYTHKGIARTTYSIANPGPLEISAESENTHSQVIKLDIPNPAGEITTPSPTPEFTPTPTEVQPTSTSQPIIAPETPIVPIEPLKTQPDLGEWIIAMLVTIGLSFGIYQINNQIGTMRWGVRGGLLGSIGGFVAYLYLVFKLPGSELILKITPPWGVILVSFLGVLVGMAAAVSWQVIDGQINRKKSEKQPGSTH